MIDRYAGQMADIHMQKLYPTPAEMAKMREEIANDNEDLSINLRNAERDARAKETVAKEYTKDRPSELAKAEKTASLANPSYANLAAQNGDMTRSIEDDTGMVIRLNEHDTRELDRFHTQCKDRAHEAVKGTNPRLDAVLAEKAMGSDQPIKDAIAHTKERQEERVRDVAEDARLHAGGHEAIEATMQEEAMDGALRGDKEALNADHMHQDKDLAEYIVNPAGEEYTDKEIAERIAEEKRAEQEDGLINTLKRGVDKTVDLGEDAFDAVFDMDDGFSR
ncbi:MAG: hypothetical protein VX730_07410 [Pseudomonadota bacterium]|nr:hypothetical protein [Pseudomonadota bacterium]